MNRSVIHLSARTSIVLLFAGLMCAALALAVRPAGATPPSIVNATVTTPAELAAAITAANAYQEAHTITLANDITLTGTLPTILGMATSWQLTINGDGHALSGADAYRLFMLGPAATVTIRNLTLTNGDAVNGSYIADVGGAILNLGTLSLEDSTVVSNTADYGAGIFTNGTLYIRRSTLEGNVASGSNTISSQGGAIYCNGAYIQSIASTFSGNIAEGTTTGQGGAIYATNCTGNLINSTFSGNTAAKKGGGIFLTNGSSMSAQDTTIVLNDAGEFGGGVYAESSSFGLVRGILSENKRDGRTADTVAGVGPEAYKAAGSGSFSLYSSVLGYRGSEGLEGTFSQSGNRVRSYQNPGDPVVGLFEPLADNGGPTWTHMPVDNSGATNPLTGEPYVDALDIDNDSNCQDNLTGGIDQRGFARAVTGHLGPVNDAQCDAGAVEYGSTEAAFLTIAKQTDPDGALDEFHFVPNWRNLQFTLSDDSTIRFALPSGNWNVAEQPAPGWNLSDVSCTNGDSMPVTLAPGDDVTCTFSNTVVGALRVVKEVTGVKADYPWQFDFASSVGNFTLNAETLPFVHEPIPAATTIAITETVVPGYTTSVICDNAANNTSDTNEIAVEMGPAEIATCTFTNAADPATITFTLQILGAVPPANYPLAGDLGDFTLSNAGGPESVAFTGQEAGPYSVGLGPRPDPDLVYAIECDNGYAEPAPTINLVLDPGQNVNCNFIVTATAVSPRVLVAAGGGKTASNLAYQKRDVLMWDAGVWTKEFSGKDAALTSTTDINAFDVDGGSLYLAFLAGQNVPGVGSTPPQDIVRYAHSAFTRVFDGSDVGLTLSSEKIDALTVVDPQDLPGSPSCDLALLISTAGDTRVPGISFLVRGGDVLSFCASSAGATTAGTWAMFIRASAEGMPATSTVGLSANPDLSTIYILSKGAFNVDSASGGASSIYKFDVATRTFSGPVWKASTNGLGQVVDSLDVEGDLP